MSSSGGLRWRRPAELLAQTIDRAIVQRQPLDATLHFLCVELARLLGCPLVWLALAEPDGCLSLRAQSWAEPAWLKSLAVRADGPVGAALRGEPPRTGEVGDELVSTTSPPWAVRAHAAGLRRFLALPIGAPDAIVGVLVVYPRPPAELDAAAARALGRFAALLGPCLRAARQLDEVRVRSAALEAAEHAVLITDRAGVIQWVNPAFTRLTGYALEELRGLTPRILRSGMQKDGVYRQLWETILDGQSWQGELYNRRKDGSLYVEEQIITPLRDAAGTISHFVAIKQDVTERARQQEQLRHATLHDPLTSLPNRLALYQRLGRVADRSRRGRPGALLVLGVDQLKLVNETLGHPAGDRMLLELAQRLSAQVRPADFLAHLEGDSFAVLLESLSLKTAHAIAERLRETVAEYRFQVEGYAFDPTVSVGIAPVHGRLDAQQLLMLADAAMYAARDSGGNRVVAYRSEHDRRRDLAQVSRWAARVKDALRDGRLLLHFQPVVRLASGRVDHFELLIRLEQDGELVAPGVFLPAAERFGLMPQIDRWVVDHAVQLLRERPALRLFVNLSGTSLVDDALLADIEARVRESGIAPRQLVLEITETTAVRDVRQSEHWMRRLKAAGCSFALDDFGMGFSSFSYLRTLPVDYVKIDGSFVHNLEADPTNLALVQAINSVAHALGKETVGEWVETPGTADVLRELGVEYGQGYLWGQPTLELPAPGRVAPTEDPRLRAG